MMTMIEELKNIGYRNYKGEVVIRFPERLIVTEEFMDELIREIEVDTACIQSGITKPTKMSQALMLILRKSY